jgi:hypothetical protein
LKFVRFATQTVSGTVWHGIYIPKLYYANPKITMKVAPPQDNSVGDIKQVWLPSEAIRIISIP